MKRIQLGQKKKRKRKKESQEMNCKKGQGEKQQKKLSKTKTKQATINLFLWVIYEDQTQGDIINELTEDLCTALVISKCTISLPSNTQRQSDLKCSAWSKKTYL